MSFFLYFVTLISLICCAFISAFKSDKPNVTKVVNKIEEVKKEEVTVQEVESEVPVKEDPDIVKIYNEKGDDEDVPNIAFPSFDDPESEIAHAFTYENLQDSFLSTGQRDTVKSRAAWSRLGQRSNDLLWQTQMNAIKEEIEKSGLTLEKFMETSLTPIPEQFADFWKQSLDLKGEVQMTAPESITKEAKSEAASLVEDSVQLIPTIDEKSAMQAMEQILFSRKRAKTLGLKVPSLSDDQKQSLKFWSTNDRTVGLVRAIESLNA